MKKQLIFILLLATGTANAQKPYSEMTAQDWAKDINYLNSKMQRQFNSYVPGIKEEFNTSAKDLISNLPSLKNYQVPCEIMRILSTLQDGHTELNIGHNTVGFHRVPLSLYIFDGDFRVVAAHEKYSDIIGNKVVSIGNQPIQEAFDKLKSQMSHDNDMEFLHAGPGYIILTELLSCLDVTSNPLAATFEFEQEDGSVIRKEFTGVTAQDYSQGPWVTYRSKHNLETPLYLSNTSESYWYRYIPESKVMYFHFSRVNNQKGKPSIKKFSKELFAEIDRVQPEKLIIDFRLNNGGNYHLSDPILAGIKSREWLNQKGKVWAITGRRTFSAASSTCIFLKQQTATTIIGEAGRTHPNKSNNNEYMTLPTSGFLIEYTTRLRKKWPERPDLDRIPPDIEILPDFASYKLGKDKVLDYLLK